MALGLPNASLSSSINRPASSRSPDHPGHVETEQAPHAPWPWPNSVSLAKSGGRRDTAPGAPHLFQSVVGAIVKGVSGGGPGLDGQHLLLLLVQQCLHVLDHDRVLDAVCLQEDFDSLDTGERHSDIDGGARQGRGLPEVQLRRTRTGTVTAGCGRAGLGGSVGSSVVCGGA